MWKGPGQGTKVARRLQGSGNKRGGGQQGRRSLTGQGTQGPGYVGPVAQQRGGFSSRSREKQLGGSEQRRDRIQVTLHKDDLTAMWGADWKQRREEAGKPVQETVATTQATSLGAHRPVGRG